MQFRFQKAYVDVLEPSGNWWIGYDASLAWGPLRLGYREVSTGGSIRRTTMLGNHKVETGRIALPMASLRLLDGEIGSTPPVFRNGVLEWRLTHSRSDATIVSGGKQHDLPGAGYGEVVTLHVPPWQLGIEQLHWGRCISRRHFVTWTIATGHHPIAFGVVDGNLVTASVDATGRVLHVGHHRIELHTPVRSITTGNPLVGRSLPVAALARWLVPRFSLLQEKAVYDTTVTLADGSSEAAMSIAEQVVVSSPGRRNSDA